jgi:hypothetical protein
MRRSDGVICARSKERSSAPVATVNLPGTQLKSLECRATMCRVEFMFDDHETERTFLRKFIQPDERAADAALNESLSGTIPSREKHEDGSRSMLVFMHKTGQPGLVCGGPADSRSPMHEIPARVRVGLRT